ncbi:uncharacterized protein LOC143215159 isoform X1 [Lasioglossum baleicum]|uniref:uncharacterized protein LOC143215159 isoform X1 n=1 Tax=Lasioglossum baleicum TaxID=434251 RepID=UPI003FCED8AA
MNVQELHNGPPLLRAIFFGAVEEVLSLLSSKEDACWEDKKQRTLLHAAAYMGDSKIVELLLLHGAAVNAKDKKWLTPLHRACCSGNHEVVHVLLRHKANVNVCDRTWQTPLHVAAANNAVKCAELLVPYLKDVNIVDGAGRTSLHYAAYNGHLEMTEYLIRIGCSVNAYDRRNNRSALHFAAFMGHDSIVKTLIDNGADVKDKDSHLYTPLHAAAASGSVSCMKVLIKAGADVKAKNGRGNTLHVACVNGHVDAVKDLIASGINIEAVNFHRQTPLHVAAASPNSVECLEVLLQAGAKINVRSKDGYTPLHMTAIYGRFTRSKSLLDAGAIADAEDKVRNTALHIAAWFGHECLTTTLLEYGASPALQNAELHTPLHLSCLTGHIEVCRKLLQADSNCIDTKDVGGRTPLHLAAYKGFVDCLDLLLSNGANFRLTDDDNRLALHYAASQGHYFCVFTLVGFGSDSNARDIDGATPLHLAAASTATDAGAKCVQYLLKHRADPRLRDKRGFTAFHYAVAGGNQPALVALLEACSLITAEGFNYTEEPDPPPPELTPLHLAAYYGHSKILSLLLPLFSDTNIKEDSGKTPLHLAASKGHQQCVKLLLNNGALVSIQDSVGRCTPIHCAAAAGYTPCLLLLLKNVDDPSIVNCYDAKQRTALTLAVTNMNTECIISLLKYKADCNLADVNKHTPLFRAVINERSYRLGKLLLSHGAKVAIQDTNGKTPLHLAAACGRISHFRRVIALAEMVRADPAAATLRDDQDCTVLHWACYNGQYDCVKYLLQENVVDTLEGNSFSPAHCAAFLGSVDCLELLINKFGGKTIAALRDTPGDRLPLHVAATSGALECARLILNCVGPKLAGIESPDYLGRTPLHCAAIAGKCEVIELLLEREANLSANDCNKNTALHLACQRRQSAAASLLLKWIESNNANANSENATQPQQQQISVINMLNEQHSTPLHLAARNGLVKVTRRLLQLGASVVAVDAEGLTPALACAPNRAVARCLATILAAHSQHWETAQHSPSIQQTSEVYLNGRSGDSQHSSDSEFY